MNPATLTKPPTKLSRSLSRLWFRFRNLFTGETEKERDYYRLELTIFKNNLKTRLQERIAFCESVIENADADNKHLEHLTEGDKPYVDKSKWTERKNSFNCVLRCLEDEK